jgi:thiol-disulfide isomerase/thioredoxin
MNRRAWLAVFAAAALGGGGGYLGYRWQSAPGPDTALTPAVPVARANGVPARVDAPNAEPALKVPETLPDVHLADLQGQKRSLRDFGRRPLIVNFWATWCEPCRREMPLLTALRDEYRSERLEIVGIAVDFRDSVSAFLQKTPLAYPQLVGEEDGMEAARAFGMQMVLPFSVFVDEQDRIIAVKVGELHRDEALAILDAMRGLRAGKVSLADTRARITRQLSLLAAARATMAASAGAAGR